MTSSALPAPAGIQSRLRTWGWLLLSGGVALAILPYVALAVNYPKLGTGLFYVLLAGAILLVASGNCALWYQLLRTRPANTRVHGPSIAAYIALLAVLSVIGVAVVVSVLIYVPLVLVSLGIAVTTWVF